tara:strand:+ start:26807 stop:26956 length:150 start_codon:yes stop_codon:yes gene_type:complete
MLEHGEAQRFGKGFIIDVCREEFLAFTSASFDFLGPGRANFKTTSAFIQ